MFVERPRELKKQILRAKAKSGISFRQLSLQLFPFIDEREAKRQLFSIMNDRTPLIDREFLSNIQINLKITFKF